MMKTKTMFLLAAVTVLAAGCIRHKTADLADNLTTVPVTPESVAENAEELHCDAALVVRQDDKMYVLFREKEDCSKSDGTRLCYAMRYMLTGYPTSWGSIGGSFRLDEPEHAVVLTRNGDNALTLTVDSVVMAVGGIAVTDSATTFRFGIDEPDREATLCFYDKATRPTAPFDDPTIQQMMWLSLIMDSLMANWEVDIDSGFVGAQNALEEATLALEVDMETMGDSIKTYRYYDEYLRMDSLAGALGFTEKTSVAIGDNYIGLEVSGGKGDDEACRKRMHRMAEAAGECHHKGYSIQHHKRLWNHSKCRFTIVW